MHRANRRHWPRHEKLHLIQFSSSLTSGYKVSSVVNFSRGGLCLVHREPLEKGSRLIVKLDKVLAGTSRDVRAKVKWCVPDRIGGYAIGVEYDTHLNWTAYE